MKQLYRYVRMPSKRANVTMHAMPYTMHKDLGMLVETSDYS